MNQSITDYRMYCFGGFRFVANNKPSFDFGSRKASALLLYLAVETPRSFSRSHLAGLLWSDHSEKKALHNLRQTLVRMRQAWPEDADETPLLISMRDTVALNPQINLWVDVIAFDTALGNARKFFDDHRRFDRLDIQNLKYAVDLFAGPVLDRFYLNDSPLFDEWSSILRERTNQKAIEAFTLMCEYFERRGDYLQAGHYAQKILELMPWSNQACAHRMRLFAVQQQWGAAKQEYNKFKKTLKQNLDVDPETSVVSLYDTIRTLSMKDEALTPAIPLIKSHLPEISQSFIGREEEISDLTSMLANPKVRLISLVGMGGIGKTRLGIRMGRLLDGLYLDGVFFIHLRDVVSAEGLIHKIIDSLRITSSASSSPRQQLLDFLRNKQCLLILDGLEYFVLDREMIGFLVELLGSVPDLKILTTSRERLNVQEEYVYLLHGLNCHPREVSEFTEDLSSEATSLFEERARQLNHQYSLAETTLPLVKKLCRLVEGHPLSIELMASATPTVSISDLLSDLEASLLALESHLLVTPSEHRSLSVVLDRSWDLLSEVQQRTLCRLACFTGNFSKEAALIISQSSPEILSSLVNKCFVRTTYFERFDLHEIIRQFAQQKSIEANLMATTLESHANFFIALLEEIAEKYQDGYQKEALEEIEVDLENIQRAWRYFVQGQQLEKLRNSINILYLFFNIRSRFVEGFTLLQSAMQSSEYLQPHDSIIGMLATRLGLLAHRQQQNELAFQLFSRSLSIFEGKGDLLELGLAYLGLANYHLRAKDLDLGLKFGNDGLACFHSLNDEFHQGTAYFLLGLVYVRKADFFAAKRMFTQSLDLGRKVGDQRGIFLRLNQLAGIACNEGDFDTAEKFYTESLALSRSFKDQYNEAIVLNNLASVYHPREEYDQEKKVLKESLAICREIGDLEGEAVALNNLGEVALVQGDYQQTFDYSRKALDIAMRVGDDWTIIAAYDILGEAYLGINDINAALNCFNQAIQIAYKIQSWDLLTRSIVNTAGVYRKQGDLNRAQILLEAAVSHPGILYEYNLKACAWLEGMGVKPLEEKNEKLLLDVLKHHFDLRSADG